MVDRYDEELFLEYVEGELPVEKRVAFENQMLQDPRLRNLVAQMVLDRHRMRTLPDEAPPDHLMDAVHERLERAMLLGASPQEFAQSKPLANKGFRWRRFATMGAMAAMVAVVAGVFVVTLVQLANDTPIRNVGPGSLFPPGMLPPALVPTKPNIAGTSPAKDPAHAADASNSSAVQHDDSSHTAAGTAANTATQQPTSGDLALVQPAVPDVQTGVTTPTQLKPSTDGGQAPISPRTPVTPLPQASLVFSVTTRDISAASRRLTSWITAYQATQLDARAFDVTPQDVKQDAQQGVKPIDPPLLESRNEAGLPAAAQAVSSRPIEAAPTANQAITLDSDASPKPVAPTTPPVPKGASQVLTPVASQVAPQVAPQRAIPMASQAALSGLMVTLALPEEQVLSLEMFLTTLPDAQVRRAVVKAPQTHATEAAAGETQDPSDRVSYVWVDREASQPSSADASNTTTADVTQQWLVAILPAWLLNPSSQVPTPLPEQVPSNAPQGQTIVRVEFIPG